MSSARKHARIGFFVLSSAVAAAACSLLNPLDGYSGGTVPDAGAPVADAPTNVPDADVPDVRTCKPNRIPDRPSPSDTTTRDRIVFAADMLELGTAQDGYDLDNLCSCPERSACASTATNRVRCDADGGVDNALGPETLAVVGLLPATDGLRPGSGTDLIRAGRYNFFIEVRGYNNTNDDDDVQVGVLGSGELEQRAGEGPDAGPRFDGQDTWSVDRDSVLGQQTTPPYGARAVDTRAYVKDGTLVARLDIDLRVGALYTKFRESVITGRMVRDGGQVRLVDGLIAGRIASTDVLTSLQTLKSPLGNSYLCRNDPVYIEARRRICAALDLSASSASDGKDVPCEAASFTMVFSAKPAQMGRLVSVPLDKPCGIDWTDDCPR
jgi:hypothetical protein